MRQSDGNKTAKRLSAIWPVQLRSTQPWSTLTPLVWTALLPEAIEGPATPALAWLARILSSLLLKTASVLPAGLLLGRATLRLPAGIEYKAARSARQRYGRVAGPKLPPSSPLRESALSPARTASGNPAGSIRRSAPASAAKSAEDTVQRTCGAANGKPCRCRNRRSGIRGTAGTTAGRGSFLPRYTSEQRNYEGAANRLTSILPLSRGASQSGHPS